jgi:N-acylneuraminate cytidylyltransferase
MKTKYNIVAVIGVKGNSERVPKKNIRPFADTTLLELKIKQLINSRSVDKIIVSSESETALNIASSFDEVLVHKRDHYYSTSHVPMSEVYSHVASEIECEHIMWSQVTSPLTGPNIYKDAINTYKNLDKKFDCLLSCVNINEYLLKDHKPINFTRTPWQKSQDLKDVKALSFSINILKKENLIKWGSLVGLNPYYIELDKETSMDIDDIHDFNLCESIYKKGQNKFT